MVTEKSWHEDVAVSSTNQALAKRQERQGPRLASSFLSRVGGNGIVSGLCPLLEKRGLVCLWQTTKGGRGVGFRQRGTAGICFCNWYLQMVWSSRIFHAYPTRDVSLSFWCCSALAVNTFYFHFLVYFGREEDTISTSLPKTKLHSGGDKSLFPGGEEACIVWEVVMMVEW